ncbi:MAG: GDP-mannose 4,6-dehydratase [Dehalococcoidia bacterium]
MTGDASGTYLVTGAAGFIGSCVVGQLLDLGARVVGVDNLNDAYDVRLKQWRLARLTGRERFRFVEADIAEEAQLAPLFDGRRPFDAVINLAARAGVRQSVLTPRIYFDTNVLGLLNLLELMRESGVPKLLLASTSSLYGASNAVPYREDAGTDRPLSPYAASKKAAEALCATYHHLHGLDVTIFRYFTVYGPAGRPDMSPFRFVQWISEGRPVTVYGNGQQSRDFTYVDDIARGTIAGLKPLGFEVINLGSDRPVVLMELIHLVERLVGKPATLVFQPRHPADMDATWADIHRAQALLGWSPTTSYEVGIERLVEWYRANRDWAATISTAD